MFARIPHLDGAHPVWEDKERVGVGLNVCQVVVKNFQNFEQFFEEDWLQLLLFGAVDGGGFAEIFIDFSQKSLFDVEVEVGCHKHSLHFSADL